MASHFTPPLLPYLLLLLLSSSTVITAINVTAVLSSFPNLSSFSNLLISSGIAAELSGRNSLTLLAVPNSHFSSSDLTRRLAPATLSDLLRFHVLLQFLSDSDLRRLPPSGSTITTLYEASGRGSGSGSVNVTRDPESGSVTIGSPNSRNFTTVLKLIKTNPPNITVLSVDSLLFPAGIIDLTASEALPPPPTSATGINLTQILINGHNFNVALSLLLASGVITDFENDERGAGITVFVPTDSAFSDLPENVNLQSLAAEQKATVLKFHVLHSYYTLGSLESITNPVQPTLATESSGAGSYTLNISRVNGSIVTINSGLVLAVVTQTAFDQNPVSVFGISKVLLPKELFPKSGQQLVPAVTAPPHEISLSPGSPNQQPSRLVSPPREIGASNGGGRRLYCGFVVVLYSILLCTSSASLY